MRKAVVAFLLAVGATAPASAQFFWSPPNFRGLPILPNEPGIGQALPGATPEEFRAHVAWQMRSGLNVAALQCKFDATLLTANSYNAVLTNHREELSKTYTTLSNYFKRTAKTAKAGQTALDQYGTRTYSSFSTVRSQLGFCQAAAGIFRDAIFVPRGLFTEFAVERLRELRNSLILAGEQQFRFPVGTSIRPALPASFENRCWDRRGNYRSRCGFTA